MTQKDSYNGAIKNGGPKVAPDNFGPDNFPTESRHRPGDPQRAQPHKWSTKGFSHESMPPHSLSLHSICYSHCLSHSLSLSLSLSFSLSLALRVRVRESEGEGEGESQVAEEDEKEDNETYVNSKENPRKSYIIQ